MIQRTFARSNQRQAVIAGVPKLMATRGKPDQVLSTQEQSSFSCQYDGYGVR